MYDYKAYADAYDKRESAGGYNNKYRHAMREMDRVLLDKLASCAPDNFSLMDLGCGNGNLLFHIKNRFPGSMLFGRELAENVINQCKQDEELSGIDFQISDILDGPTEAQKGHFDFVVLIAVMQVFPKEIWPDILSNIRAFLKPGGIFLNVDGYHDYDEIEWYSCTITPSASLCPNDLDHIYVYPSKTKGREMLEIASFTDVDFQDIELSFDLKRIDGNPYSTHTAQLIEGRRISMLGVLHQPWALVTATAL